MTITIVQPSPIKGAAKAKVPGMKPRAKFPWEGNKTGAPRPRGAGHAHRVAQVQTSSYPKPAKNTIGAAMKALGGF